MATFIREITTTQGDVLRVGLSSERKLLSLEALEAIGDTEFMGVELQRIKGSSFVGHEALQSIEDYIARLFLQNEKMIVFYYCDFINPIPKTSKTNMSPQEYRSRLFEKMFERYVSQNRINGVHLSVITVEGTEETFYFHLIYREIHSNYVAIIDKDLQEGYSK